MAVALLIGLWVYYQFSYDRFLPGYQHVYQVRYRYNNNGEILTQNSTCLPLAEVVKKDVPGVKYVVQTDWMGQHGLKAGEKKLYLNGAMAGSDFLKMFQYPILKGNINAALKEPYSIVLTESTALAYRIILSKLPKLPVTLSAFVTQGPPPRGKEQHCKNDCWLTVYIRFPF